MLSRLCSPLRSHQRSQQHSRVLNHLTFHQVNQLINHPLNLLLVHHLNQHPNLPVLLRNSHLLSLVAFLRLYHLLSPLPNLHVHLPPNLLVRLQDNRVHSQLVNPVQFLAVNLPRSRALSRLFFRLHSRRIDRLGSRRRFQRANLQLNQLSSQVASQPPIRLVSRQCSHLHNPLLSLPPSRLVTHPHNRQVPLHSNPLLSQRISLVGNQPQCLPDNRPHSRHRNLRCFQVLNRPVALLRSHLACPLWRLRRCLLDFRQCNHLGFRLLNPRFNRHRIRLLSRARIPLDSQVDCPLRNRLRFLRPNPLAFQLHSQVLFLPVNLVTFRLQCRRDNLLYSLQPNQRTNRVCNLQDFLLRSPR